MTHRRLLGPAPGLRPCDDPVVFDRIGGQPTVDQLVDSLYDRFEADGVIRPMFGRDLTKGRAHQKRFFAEWLGGPPRYSESIWAGLHQQHEDLPITPSTAARWLDHLRHALQDAGTDEGDAAIIIERARSVAEALVNEHDAPPSGRQVPSSRHRSERIASCGVGARTLAQAERAAHRGEVDELAELAGDVPDILSRAVFSARLLQVAALAGRAEVVEWLIDRGVDPDTPSPLPVGLIGSAMEGVLFVTPLCAAHLKRRAEIRALLLRGGAHEDVFTAAFLGDQALLQSLLAARPSLAQVSDPATDVLTITPVHHAVAGDQVSSLRSLLKHTTEPVRTGARALRAASQRGNQEMVELLLDHGADAHAIGPGRWVLDTEIAPLLARAGASAGIGPDGEVSGEWVKASCTGNRGRKDDPNYVAALLRYGARVDQRHLGASPLHHAVRAGFVQTIYVLLDHGADIDSTDDRALRPRDWLSRAAKSVDRDAVRAVLETGQGR